MRHEEEKMPPPLLSLRVSKCPRVYWVPTPRSPVATHEASPGMCGMSPARWGSCQSLGQRLVPPCWETSFKHWRRSVREKEQRLLQEESKSFYGTGPNPNGTISLKLRTTLYTSYSRIKVTHWVSTRPLSLASCNTWRENGARAEDGIVGGFPLYNYAQLVWAAQ